jgi:large subunit ribosomal protein L15
VLRERGIVKETGTPVKILGRGEIAKALTIRAHKFSESAVKKIAAAGGVVEVIA